MESQIFLKGSTIASLLYVSVRHLPFNSSSSEKSKVVKQKRARTGCTDFSNFCSVMEVLTKSKFEIKFESCF